MCGSLVPWTMAKGVVEACRELQIPGAFCFRELYTSTLYNTLTLFCRNRHLRGPLSRRRHPPSLTPSRLQTPRERKGAARLYYETHHGLVLVIIFLNFAQSNTHHTHKDEVVGSNAQPKYKACAETYARIFAASKNAVIA